MLPCSQVVSQHLAPALTSGTTQNSGLGLPCLILPTPHIAPLASLHPTSSPPPQCPSALGAPIFCQTSLSSPPTPGNGESSTIRDRLGQFQTLSPHVSVQIFTSQCSGFPAVPDVSQAPSERPHKHLISPAEEPGQDLSFCLPHRVCKMGIKASSQQAL